MWIHGDQKLVRKLGDVKAAFMHEPGITQFQADHALVVVGGGGEFDRVWKGKPTIKWVTCQVSALSDQTQYEAVIGTQIECSTFSLVAMFNPFNPVAQEAVQDWRTKARAKIVLPERNALGYYTMDITDPFKAASRVPLDMVLTAHDALSHLNCVETLLGGVPEYLNRKPAVYTIASAASLTEMMRGVLQ